MPIISGTLAALAAGKLALAGAAGTAGLLGAGGTAAAAGATAAGATAAGATAAGATAAGAGLGSTFAAMGGPALLASAIPALLARKSPVRHYIVYKVLCLTHTILIVYSYI